MKISSWNVNSVRARIANILSYLKYSKPEVLMLQEIKTEDKNFPYDDFKTLGYKSYVYGQKGYNGVAFISKVEIDNIDTKFFEDPKKQSRIIAGNIRKGSKNIKLLNIYAPNGNPIGTEKYDYKLSWYEKFIKKVKKILKINKNIIIAGDFNIIPEKDDVHDYTKYENDALFKLEIRKKFRELANLGFEDIYRYINLNKQEFTFWDYMAGSFQRNNGMRIDHFLVSTNLLKSVKKIFIDKKPRAKIKPSDHTPIELELN